MHLGIKNFVGGAKKYLFGDGSYSGNIIQGGSALQPQDYVLYGPDLAPPAVLSYTGTLAPSYPMSQLVDASNTTGGSMSSTTTATRFIFDYGTAKRIRRVVTSCNIGGTVPVANLAYSDDGTNWTNVQGITTPVSAAYTTTDIADVGAHRFWSLAWVSGYLQYTTVRMHEGEVITNCIVVTGAATVAPDATTGAAWFSCQNIVIDGGSLAPSTNCKGIIGLVSGSVRLVNGGRIHIDKLGKAGNFGNLTVLDLVPASLKRKLKSSLASYTVQGEGAAGVAGVTGTTGATGVSAADGTMKCGGGGSGGSASATSGAGGKGGPCCGGAGSGASSIGQNSAAAGAYGGPGSAGVGSYQEGGGAGDPVGAGVGGATAGKGPGGGLLMLFAPLLSIASGCIISADGAAGGDSGYGRGGGGSGGGNVTAVTLVGGLSNNGTIRANGGLGGVGASGYPGGPGGAGSVNTFTLAA